MPSPVTVVIRATMGADLLGSRRVDTSLTTGAQWAINEFVIETVLGYAAFRVDLTAPAPETRALAEVAVSARNARETAASTMPGRLAADDDEEF